MAHLASIKSFFLVFFLVTGLCLPPVVLAADATGQAGDSSTQELSVKGYIRSVSISDQTFILKKVKGRMRLSLDPQTVFVGFSDLKDLKSEDRVRVWYRLDATRNIAVKIAKLPDLGC
jgi:hypothetical protein